MFETAERKINRARYHFEALQDALQGWRADAVELEWVTAYNGHRRVIAKVVRPVPPEAIGSLEELLQSARAALDHIVYEAVDDRHRRDCAFPVPRLARKKPWSATPGEKTGSSQLRV